MPEVLLQKHITRLSRCIKCERREATSDDGLCDHCRFMLTLQTVTKKEEDNSQSKV